MPEQRVCKRFDFDGALDLKADNGGRGIVRAYLDDIGLGGFRIHSEEEMEINKEVKFALLTPLSDRPLLGKGRIKHINAVKVHGSDFFSIGVRFTRINKNRIKQLINKALGWHKRPFLSPQHRRELSLLLKLSPVMILITWSILSAYYSSYYNGLKEQQYAEKFRKAAIYYLYQ